MQQKNLEIFHNSSDLIDKLKEEAKKKEFARFPVRFILIEDASSWEDVINFLKDLVTTVIYLSDFCSGEDTYPNINAGISKAIESVRKSGRVLLLPLSELLRIDRTIKSRIIELIELQADPSKNGRLYIPLYCAKSYFLDIWSEHFDKIRLCPPFLLQSDTETTTRVWVINNEELLIQDSINLTTGSGFKAYLRTWETGKPPEKFLVYSDLIYELVSQISGKVSVSRVENWKELLEKIVGVNIPIKYTKNEEGFWKELINLFISTGSGTFEELVKKKLNAITFSKKIFYRWKELSEIDRWLLFYWGKSEFQDKNSYLYYVLQNSSFFDFERMIWLAILNAEDITIENLKERIDLITKLEIDRPSEYISEIKRIEDPIKKIKILTGVTFDERLEIIKSFAQCLKEGLTSPRLLEIIKIVFPELYYYISIPDLGNKNLNKYTKNYVYSKIRNELTKELMELSDDLSEKNIFLDFPTRNNVLENYRSYQQLWIDGLGIEWIGLIYNLIKNKYRNYKLQYKITRANLPTTTEFNVIPENAEKELCLDRIFHETDYKHPENLIKEFECIQRILEKIDLILKTYGKIVITSDHGATRFSGWVDKKITTPKDAQVERQGRYIISFERPKERDDYYIEKHENKFYLVSKSYKTFEGGKKATGENHGGAAVEEILVPVIVIERSKPSVVKVKILEKRISALNPVLKLRIYPPVEVVNLRICNELVAGERIDDENWRFYLKLLNLKPGEYKVSIELPEDIKEDTIYIESGMKEEDLL